MSDELIYVKSQKGMEEIDKRSHGLPPRARQVLILLDGKRTIDDVAEMLSGDETLVLLDDLFAKGFIEEQQGASEAKVPQTKPAAPAKAAPKPVAAKPAATQPKVQDALPQNEAERLEMAKNFMRNTVRTFLGGMGSGFISHVDQCNSIEELRRNFGPWKEAIELSRDGRKQLLELEQRLMRLLA
jgi:hypothetical protein